MTMTDPLKPTSALLCKLSSIAVHADEMISPDGHDFDREALLSLIGDREVRQWVKEMTALGFAPVKRNLRAKNGGWL